MCVFDNATLMITGGIYNSRVFSHMTVMLKYASYPW